VTDSREQVGFISLGGQTHGDAMHPRLLACLSLRANVHATRGIVPHEHDCQTRLYSLLGKPLYPRRDRSADPIRYRPTVYQVSGQSRRLSFP
jgi:hypothetical protein